MQCGSCVQPVSLQFVTMVRCIMFAMQLLGCMQLYVHAMRSSDHHSRQAERQGWKVHIKLVV